MLALPILALLFLWLWEDAPIAAVTVLGALWAPMGVTLCKLRGEQLERGQVDGFWIGVGLWAFVIFS